MRITINCITLSIIEFFNNKANDNWVVPTLDELYLIYFSKNRLSEINFDGVSPSSSLTLAPGISNTSYGLWLKNLNNNENYFDDIEEKWDNLISNLINNSNYNNNINNNNNNSFDNYNNKENNNENDKEK